MNIAFIGSLPAASVLPQDCIRERYRGPAHPAPWISELLPRLAELSKHRLRIILPQYAVAEPVVTERDGVEYEGVPCVLLERFARKTGMLEKSLKFRRAARSFGADVVHAFGLETGAATIALRSGLPVSGFIQGIAEYNHPFYSQLDALERNIRRGDERRAITRIKWLIGENEFAKSWAVSRNPNALVEVIPHPFRRIFLEQNPPDFGKVILNVGSLDPRKGVDTILKAFSLVEDTDARLRIVGSGYQRSELEKLAEDLRIGDRVAFLGPLSTEEVLRAMREASVVVTGSRVDTSPNVVTEAHAFGLPVIGTRVGGIPEMIDEGQDGWLVNVDDYEAMAKRMKQALAAPDQAREMGMHGREKIRVLNDPDRIARAHAEYFGCIERELKRS